MVAFSSFSVQRLPSLTIYIVPWPWLSLLQGWGSLTMGFTCKFVYIYIYIYIYYCCYYYLYICIYIYIYIICICINVCLTLSPENILPDNITCSEMWLKAAAKGGIQLLCYHKMSKCGCPPLPCICTCLIFVPPSRPS